MNNKLVASVIALSMGLASMGAAAETVKIERPKWLPGGSYDGKVMFPDSLTFDSEAEELTFPDLGVFVRLGEYDFPNLRKVTVGGADYMPSNSFHEMPLLEEVVIDGMVGHFDCTFVNRCPNLRKVTFNGPVSSTGGPGFTFKCPSLEEVTFNGAMVNFDLAIDSTDLSPKLDRFTINGAILKSSADSPYTSTDLLQLRGNPRLRAELDSLARWQARVLTATVDNEWLRKSAYDDAKVLHPVLIQIGSPEAEPLKAAMEYAWNMGDDVKTKLEILKSAPGYATDTLRHELFAYVKPGDATLTATRERFNLDSIAGDGDDISRIKNLLYWVHDNITHNGSNGIPEGPRNLTNIYDSAKRNNCGYNCRALAISLCEALLAEGIPARYLTCVPKAWETDPDCHVICVAWSESLDKWIWVDPTFAAYVTDENGLLLHPGEVRHRLVNDLPVVLNADANWNNVSPQTKEQYLDYYMAKNLYILQANTLNQAEPEGETDHRSGLFVSLIPPGCDYTNAHIVTSDDQWFWQAPSHWLERSLLKADDTTE